jgi:hypothetical protein
MLGADGHAIEAAPTPPPQFTLGMPHILRFCAKLAVGAIIVGTAASAAPSPAQQNPPAPPGWRRIAVPAPSDERLACANHADDEWRVSAGDNETSVRIERVGTASSTGPLATDDGQFEWWDSGEFGGGAVFRSAAGRVDTVIDDNVVALYAIGSEIRALVGLAHMGSDRGAVLAVRRDARGIWTSARIADLGAAPYAHVRVSPDTTLVVTSKRALLVATSGAITTLYETDSWFGLYPTSIARTRGGAIYVGLRAAVTELSPDVSGFRAAWLIQSPCTDRAKYEFSTVGCRCLGT